MTALVVDGYWTDRARDVVSGVMVPALVVCGVWTEAVRGGESERERNR